jgi:branched-chain amino acid transport system ATP-binding protein
MSMDDILVTDGLSKSFGDFRAVSDVSLRVKRGTIHALIGPNGAGKTTCFNMLTKFIAPTDGRITFNGRDITSLRPADVARLGLVRSFQISAVFPHLTAFENIRIALQRKRGDSFDFWRSKAALEPLNQRALALLDDVGLTSFANSKAGERTAELIRRVSANRTILMVEHNLKVVANLSHRITVLTRGRVLAEGDYREVSENEEVKQAYMGVGNG